jgi:hypothetical protein
LLLAVVIDTGTFVLVCGAATLCALAWMLARTDAGAVDVSGPDAAFALSLMAAALPAWTAWRWRALFRNGTTFGSAHSSSRATITTHEWRRALWLALHPVSTPAWAWLVGMLALLMPPLTAAALWSLAALTGLSVVSLVLLLLQPRSRPLHVRLAMLRAKQDA